MEIKMNKLVLEPVATLMMLSLLKTVVVTWIDKDLSLKLLSTQKSH